MILRAGREILEAVRDLLFPARCAFCDAPLEISSPQLLCQPCLQRVRSVRSPWCPCCGMPYSGGDSHLCAGCLRQTPDCDLARSSLHYREPVRSLILRWKFHGDLYCFSALLRLLAREPPGGLFPEPDIVVGVPLHRKRLQSRGFNQALQLARHAFPQWRGRVHPQALIRSRSTIAQAGLSGPRRRRNLEGAFVVTPSVALHNRSVLLVDDVWTTGTTIRTCARVLKDAGAVGVHAWTLARVVL